MSISRGWAVIATGTLAASLAVAQGGFDGPGRYEITNLKSGKVLDLDRNDQTTVIQFSSRGTDNQSWDIESAGSDLYYIRNGMNGKALEMTRNSNSSPVVCARFDRSPNQQWRLELGKDGNTLIVSRGGRTLDIPDGSSRDGLRVQIYDRNGDSNQRFIFHRVGRAFPDRRDARRFDSDRNDRNLEPDRLGRYWDERDQIWRLAGDGVCFYERTDFRGDALCTRVGNDIGEVGPDDSFSSIRFFGRVQNVEVFERPGFRGGRVRITRDERDLGRLNLGRFGSFRAN